MKRKERHQLKENEFAEMIVRARGVVEARGKHITAVVVVAAVAVLGVVGFRAWQTRANARAELLLADAMVAFNARVVPVSSEPTQPGEVPAAASLGATGSYPTVAAKLNEGHSRMTRLRRAVDGD